MNAQDIASVAAGAGFSGEALRIAVAIALAESGGNPGAHNGRAPDDSYGLWQINMLGALGPQRRAALGLRSNSDLFDPMTNARAAFMISGGGSNFNDWATFNPRNGTTPRYLAYLPSVVPSQPGTPPVQTPPIDTSGGDVSSDPPGAEVETLDVGLLSGVPTWLVIAGGVTAVYFLTSR